MVLQVHLYACIHLHMEMKWNSNTPVLRILTVLVKIKTLYMLTCNTVVKFAYYTLLLKDISTSQEHCKNSNYKAPTITTHVKPKGPPRLLVCPLAYHVASLLHLIPPYESWTNTDWSLITGTTLSTGRRWNLNIYSSVTPMKQWWQCHTIRKWVEIRQDTIILYRITVLHSTLFYLENHVRWDSNSCGWIWGVVYACIYLPDSCQ